MIDGGSVETSAVGEGVFTLSVTSTQGWTLRLVFNQTAIANTASSGTTIVALNITASEGGGGSSCIVDITAPYFASGLVYDPDLSVVVLGGGGSGGGGDGGTNNNQGLIIGLAVGIPIAFGMGLLVIVLGVGVGVAARWLSRSKVGMINYA